MNFINFLQAGSGLLFSSFTLLHLGGHGLALVNFKLADSAMFAAREVYQSQWTEPLFIGAGLIHMLCSSVKWFYRKPSNASNAISWHRYAGMVSMGFIVPHFIGARLLPLLRITFLYTNVSLAITRNSRHYNDYNVSQR
jgi:hypothetical protein